MKTYHIPHDIYKVVVQRAKHGLIAFAVKKLMMEVGMTIGDAYLYVKSIDLGNDLKMKLNRVY